MENWSFTEMKSFPKVKFQFPNMKIQYFENTVINTVKIKHMKK